MAINQNINPYIVGNVVADNRPFLQFYQQQLAQRQAKESALDNYFRDLGKNITPAGMRNQDVEGLTKRTNEWRQFYAQNKDNINDPRKDGGKAYTEYMSRYQDQLGYIDKSKNRLKTTDELGKLRLDPNRSYILDDESLMPKFKAHDLSLDDPNSKDLNIMEIATPPKPWDMKDQVAHSAYLTHGLEVDKIPGKTQNIGGFKTSTPITKQYSDQNLKLIGDKSGDMYDMNRSLQFATNQLVKQIEKDPNRLNKLNSIFYRLYGHDMQTPRDMRMAQDIMNENKKSIEYEKGEDVYGRQVALEYISFGHKRQLKKEDQEAADNWVVNFWDKRVSNAKSGQPTPLPEPNNPLTIRMSYEIEPDAVMMKGLARNNTEPDAVFVTVDNKIMPIFYVKEPYFDDKGKKLGTEIMTDAAGNPLIDKSMSKPMSMDQAYLALGYRGQTKKKLGGTMQGVYGGKEKYPLPSGKPRTVSQGGHTYTWNPNTGSYE
jgi:hypothetical protein